MARWVMLETAYAGRCQALLSRIALTRLVSASDRCPSQAWLTPSSAEQVRQLRSGGGAVQLGVDQCLGVSDGLGQ